MHVYVCAPYYASYHCLGLNPCDICQCTAVAPQNGDPSALIFASEKGDLKAVQALLDAGADKDAKDTVGVARI